MALATGLIAISAGFAVGGTGEKETAVIALEPIVTIPVVGAGASPVLDGIVDHASRGNGTPGLS